jgi:3-phenylpropionate/trans-cinnamate dioxygenase ferredoxin reductase component
LSRVADSRQTIVIVGAGQAGYWAAVTLRQKGFSGEILLLGDESHPPYERPPLSKDALTSDVMPNSIWLANSDNLAAQHISWRPNARVAAIDRAKKRLQLATGESTRYDLLLLATGGRARALRLRGMDPQSVLYLRTLDDASALRRALQTRGSLLVVGGGWIGLEIAASARRMGIAVTLVEAAPRLGARVLPPMASDILLGLHQRNGVDVQLSCVVDSVDGENGRLVAHLSDGTSVSAGFVVAGVGMIPNMELAEQAGLQVADGILVDAHGRTSDDAIFAAGDVARYPSQRFGQTLRPESWSHAQNHGISVARAMMGEETPYDPIPWFWSDQYDVNIQIAGLADLDDRPVIRGTPARGDGTIFYCRRNELTTAISFNRPRENRIAKKLIEQGTTVEPVQLANDSVELRAGSAMSKSY